MDQYRSSPALKTKPKHTDTRGRVGDYVENDEGTWVLASDYEDV